MKVTLVYKILSGILSPAAFVDKVAAVPIFANGELDLLGLVVDSDETTPGERSVFRTIVLSTTAQGDEQWCTPEELAAATRNLYKAMLELGVPGRVFAEEPVVVVDEI